MKCDNLRLTVKRQKNDTEEFHRSMPTSSISSLHHKVSLHSSGSDFSTDMFNFLRANDDDEMKSESVNFNSTSDEADSKKASHVIQILDLESNRNSIVKPFESDSKQLVCCKAILKPGFNSILVTGEVCSINKFLTAFCGMLTYFATKLIKLINVST